MSDIPAARVGKTPDRSSAAGTQDLNPEQLAAAQEAIRRIVEGY